MSQRLLLVAVAVLAALVLGLALFWHPEVAQTPAGARQAPGGDFTLQSASGPVSLADFRGKAVVLVFGYTYCPDVCPTTLAATAAALKSLRPAEAARVASLFISVDPERDSPTRLKEYTAFFHPDLVGLTGSPAQVAAVARQYGIFYARQNTGSAGGDVIDHTAETLIIGPDGKVAGRLPHGATPDQVAAEIRRHLDF